MFNPSEPYEREQRHSKSRRQLSIAQIIALRSIDVETVALIWLMLECGASLTVAGPTEPKPGVGKTTALHALLQFLPEGTAVAYMFGMYETFAFTRLPDIDPANTYALCSEVSDHMPTYMWGQIARRFLMLPAQCYHIATSVHADTIEDVLHLYQHDLHLPIEDLRRLGLVVNIGLVGGGKFQRRRWLTTHFLCPQAEPGHPEAITLLSLSRWNECSDAFEHADQFIKDELANWAGLAPQEFTAALKHRATCLQELAQGQGADMNKVYAAIKECRQQDTWLKIHQNPSVETPPVGLP
jgi:hypothetical protein